MPTINLNKKVFEDLVGKKLPLEKLKDRISMIGTDLESIKGNEIVVEVFPNRPDMLSEQGFARAFSSFIGARTGLRKYDVKKSGESCKVEKTLKIWPYSVTAIVKGLKFDDEKIREIIQIQEKLGVTLLRGRKKGGLGIYPLDKIKFPITFTTEVAEKIKFRPLEYPREITGRQILSKHPTGREYAHIIEAEKEFPVFIDSAGTIMSMPPIINSHDVGKIDEKTRDVFVEATGPDLNILLIALNIFVTSLADMGGQLYSMDVHYPNKKITTPDLEPRKMKFDIGYANKLLGMDFKKSDVKKLLEKMGFGYEGKEVLVPAYRADILHPIDLVEDIAIAYGYENFEAGLPSVVTTGEIDAFENFKSKVANILAGLGLIETITYHLTSKEKQCSMMNCDIPLVELANALNVDYSVMRAWMIPSLLEVLENNKHNEYPQKIFDIGTIFKKDKSTETGVKEAARLCVMSCHETVDYTEARQMFDYLMRMLDLKYEVKDADHSSFIPGRVARVSVKGKDVAYIGEISPEVLSNYDLQVPVAAFELNLSDLFEVME